MSAWKVVKKRIDSPMEQCANLVCTRGSSPQIEGKCQCFSSRHPRVEIKVLERLPVKPGNGRRRELGLRTSQDELL